MTFEEKAAPPGYQATSETRVCIRSENDSVASVLISGTEGTLGM